MIKKLRSYIKLFKEIDIYLFLYLNYFCKNVVRTGNGKFIPYKNAKIDLEDGARIYIRDEDLEIGCDKLKKSKKETWVKVARNAIWSASGGCKVSYGSTIEIQKNALFEHGYFTMNANSTMIVRKHVSFGNDVMISRNVIIYDSDFHTLLDNGHEVNAPEDVVIGNHVWIGVNSVVLKGVHISDGTVVAANALISKSLDSNVLVASENKIVCIKKAIEWRR